MVIEASETSTIRCINPANRQLLAEIRTTSVAEIHALVARSRKAFESWRKTSLNSRLDLLERFRNVLVDNQDAISEVITRETGKPRVESLVSEIFGVLETCTWLKANARAILSPKKVALNPIFFFGKDSHNVYEPHGVVAVISPWNYPFSIPFATILTALVAGNSVVLKPSPKTAYIAQTTMDLFKQAGFPHDLVVLVQGDKLEAETLIQSDVNRVMFTGSTGGGKAIMQLCARKLLPVTLELGGKHPAIIVDDSDIDAIAPALVWCAFTNAGQACASIERLYVPRSISTKLTQRIVEHASKLRLGDGLLPESDVGPLVDEQQLRRVHEQIEKSVKQGAVVAAGGKVRSDLGGFFLEPTVLTGVTADMPVIAEEIFGPVLPIVEVDDIDDAVRQANNSSLGLGASVWTRDRQKGEELARRLEAGMVWINNGLFTHVCPDAPWGGIKESGFGRMHSATELHELVYVKNIAFGAQSAQDWNFPYSKDRLDFVRAGMDLIHQNGLGKKLSALTRLIASRLRANDDQ